MESGIVGFWVRVGGGKIGLSVFYLMIDGLYETYPRTASNDVFIFYFQFSPTFYLPYLILNRQKKSEKAEKSDKKNFTVIPI